MNPDLRSAEPTPFHWAMAPKWTGRESNPDLLVAGQVSSRWTSRPNPEWSVGELNPVVLRAGQDSSPLDTPRRGPSGGRTRSSAIPQRCAASNTYRPTSDPGRTRTFDYLGVNQEPLPLDDEISIFSDRGGSRTLRITRLSTWPLFRFAYSADKLRVRELNPSNVAYETSSSTGPPAIVAVAKGRVELPRPNGHNFLGVACPTFHLLASVTAHSPSRIGTGGSRTRRQSPRFELGRFSGLRTVPFQRPGRESNPRRPG